MASVTLRSRVAATFVVTALLTGLFLGDAALPAYAAAGDISTFTGTGSSGYSGDGGPATAAQLNGPYGMAADASGNVYIADPGNNVVRKVTTAGIISTFAGTGSSGYSGDGGPAAAAELRSPCGVALDGAGNMYIADTGNHVVRKVTPGGTISTVAGSGGYGFSGDGGPATAATFTDIYRVLPAGGNLYISDYSNARVRKVNGAGIIDTIAGDGSNTTAGDGGPATAASLNVPVGLAMDTSGNLYVAQAADYAPNHRVRKIDTSGIITTFAGRGDTASDGDGGAAVDAGIRNPLDLAFDSTGRMLISEYAGNKVRRVDVSGVIHTVAGSGSASYSGDGDTACFGRLNGPLGLAQSPAGDVYVADNSNNVVRKIAAPIADCPVPRRGLVTDFDRDIKADIAVYRPSAGTFFDHPSGGGADTGTAWGAASDVPVNADYDGDYRSDQAVYRPSSGLWAIHASSGGDTYVTYGGTGGDVPVPADYDGDGKVDIAIYRASLGFWYIHRSSDDSDVARFFGDSPGLIPVPADYDGDGRADVAVFKPSTGTSFVHPSGNPDQDFATTYGASGDIPLPADYDGDAIADLAIFRPSSGLWAIHHSIGGPDTFVTYGGVGGDVPVVTDYDGDGKADIAVNRPSLGAWYVHKSSTSADAITTFGIATDKPLAIAPAVRLTFFP